MKKLFLILITLLFAVSVYAEDRLSLSGSMYVRGYDWENYSSFDDNDKSDVESFYEQRFRMAAKLQVAEGVSANLRFDFDEDKWGSTNFDGTRPDADTELQVDRAYLAVDQEYYSVAAGLMYFGLGNTIAFDANKHGLVLASKGFPVNALFAYAKLSENGALDYNATGEARSYRDDNNGTEFGDFDAYALNLNYSADDLSANVFYALADNDATGFKATLIGLQGTYKTGMLSFNGELDIFGGDNGGSGTSKVDLVGTQFYGNVEAAINEQLTVGADIFYAAGTDDANETQITELSEWNSWGKLDRGAFNTDILAGSEEFDIAKFESSSNAGSKGLGIYADYKVIDKLLIQGGIVYLKPQEDKSTSIDKVYVYNLSATYDLAPNTTLAAGYNIVSIDKDDNSADDSANALVCRIQLEF